MFLINELAALLMSNLILMRALGTSTLFIAAESRRNLIGTASVITIFTTLGAMAAYFINRMAGVSFAGFTLLFYTLAIGIIYVITLTVFYLVSRNNFEKFRKYIHLAAFNCAVMGTLFTITENEALTKQELDLTGYLACGFEAGIGFVIASVILTAAYKRLNSSKVPTSFRGFPAMLVYLGIISMAVYALK